MMFGGFDDFPETSGSQTVTYSSSSYSSSSGGHFESHSTSTSIGPGGVRQTTTVHEDSSGTRKVAKKRQIGNKAIETIEEQGPNQQSTIQNKLSNVSVHEVNDFNKEWEQRQADLPTSSTFLFHDTDARERYSHRALGDGRSAHPRGPQIEEVTDDAPTTGAASYAYAQDGRSAASAIAVDADDLETEEERALRMQTSSRQPREQVAPSSAQAPSSRGPVIEEPDYLPTEVSTTATDSQPRSEHRHTSSYSGGHVIITEADDDDDDVPTTRAPPSHHHTHTHSSSHGHSGAFAASHASGGHASSFAYASPDGYASSAAHSSSHGAHSSTHVSGPRSRRHSHDNKY